MSDSAELQRDAEERRRDNLRLANLEADVAYFLARLEILGEPETANQLAQQRTFKLLRKTLADLILRNRRRILEGNYTRR